MTPSLLRRVVRASTGAGASLMWMPALLNVFAVAPARAAQPNAAGDVAGKHEQAVEVGRGGGDGFVATGPKGMLHVVVGGGKYRTGREAASLSVAEPITESGPVNGVRIAVDAHDRPHVVFTRGLTGNAKQSFYTARIDGRWLPAEKFADAADFSERERAYVADVAVDESGTALVCFWVGRPEEKRQQHDDPSFYYRWRSPAGKWSAPQTLSSHWSSTPKVDYASGRGFYLLWQHRRSDWRIAGPVQAGAAFTVEQSFTTGSESLTATLSTVQNEGAEFCVADSSGWVVASNIREKFEGPVGVWAAFGRERALGAPVYLGSFPETVRGNESGVHPVVAFDAATGAAFLTVMDPRTKTARFAIHRKDRGWERAYPHVLPGASTPQGTLRQGPSVADVPGPGVIALVRDGEERWFLKRLVASPE